MTGSPSAPEQTTGAASSLRESRREFLERSLQVLWPGTARAQFGGRQRQDGASQFVLLPNGHDPRVVLPRNPYTAAAATFSGLKASATWQTRTQLRLLSLGARVGGATLFPDQVIIRPAGESESEGIDDYLSTALSQPVHLALLIGPPRANRKPVLQVISADGQTFAFAKIGVSPLTEKLVSEEASTLRRLNSSTFRFLVVPRLLHHGRFEGHAVAVQSALRGRASEEAQIVLQAMLELASTNASSPQVAASTSYWRRLEHKVTHLPSSSSATSLQHALQLLASAASAVQIRLGAWHGDWTPWNMAVTDRYVALWDWERFEPDVPWGFDALHHHLQGSIIRRKGVPRESAVDLLAQAPRLLAPFGASRAAAEFTSLVYLVGLAARYLFDDMAGAGGRLGAVEAWLLPVLLERLGSTEGTAA